MPRPNPAPESQSIEDICRGLPLSDPARALMSAGMPPLVYLETLLNNKQFHDAFLFMAGWLPLEKGIWWACLCAWHTERPAPSPAVAATYQAVVQWLLDPTEQRRREAETAMKAAPPKALGTAVAQAVFYSGGSIAPPGLPEILPPPTLPRQVIADTVFQATTGGDIAKAREHGLLHFRIALQVLDGRNRWER